MDLGEFLGNFAPDVLQRPLPRTCYNACCRCAYSTLAVVCILSKQLSILNVTKTHSIHHGWICPSLYAAPEITFPRVALNTNDPPWDQRSDIWSLGVTVSRYVLHYLSSTLNMIQFHNLVGVRGLFPELYHNTMGLPHYMVCICGEIPDAWRDHIESKP